MDAKDFLLQHNIELDEKDLRSFKQLTGEEPYEALNKILNAMQKLGVDEDTQISFAKCIYSWYELYETPESEIKDFMRADGTIDGDALYNWAITD